MNRKAVVLLIFTIILSACGSAVGEEKVMMTPPEAAITSPSPTALPSAIPTITPWPTDTPTPVPDILVSVLMGGDADAAHPERNQYGVRSDVFVIAIVDVYDYIMHDGKMAITLVSVPRDLWVEVPCTPKEGGYDRVNAAWAYGGFECVQEMVELNFLNNGEMINDYGIHFDYEILPFAYVEFDGFIELIDFMGGIEVTPSITHTEWCGNYYEPDVITNKFITWRAGQTYHMTGKQALCYARGRTHPEGDLDRNRRGLELMWAMVEQYPSKLFKSNKLVDVINGFIEFWYFASQHLEISLTLDEIVRYLPYVPDVQNAEWKSIKFTTEEVEFWTEPEHELSVLRSKIDIPKWLYCKMYLESESYDPENYCTESYMLATPTPSGPTPYPDWAYEQYGPPWIPNCENEDMYDGVALPAWANGFCVPGRITWESQFFQMPSQFYGSAVCYNPGRMERQVQDKGYDPAKVSGVSLPSCSEIHETVWLRFAGSSGWQGPFKVVDCSGRNHLYYHMVGMGIVVEIGHETAKRWGTCGVNKIDVHIGTGKPGSWNGLYLPYWWLENILEWESPTD